MPSTGPLSRNVQVRLAEDDYAQLRDLAAAAEIRIAEVIRLLLRWALLPDPTELEKEIQLALETGDSAPARPLELIRHLKARQVEDAS